MIKDKILYILSVLFFLFLFVSCPPPPVTASNSVILTDGSVVYNSESNVLPFKLECEQGAVIASEILELTNNSDKRISVTSVAFVNSNFSILSEEGKDLIFPVFIETEETVSFMVVYTPSQGGVIKSDMVVSYYESVIKSKIIDIVITVSGRSEIIYGGENNTGVDIRGQNISGYDFSSVLIGSKKSLPFVLDNVSKDNQTITIYNVLIDNPQFELFGFKPFTDIYSNTSLEYYIDFIPLQTGIVESVISLFTSKGLFEFNLVGEGLLNSESVFELSKNDKTFNLDSIFRFSDVVMNETGEGQLFEITNRGVNDLKIDNITSSLPLDIDATGLPITLSYGDIYRFSVQFHPVDTTLSEGLLSINYNGNSFFGLNVKAQGLAEAGARLALFDEESNRLFHQDELRLPAVEENTIARVPFKLKNLGATDLTITGLNFESSEFRSDGITSFPFTIAAGNFIEFDLIFQSEYINDLTCLLEIYSNDPFEPIFQLDLKGNCIFKEPLYAPQFTCDDYSLDSRTIKWEWRTVIGSCGIGLYRYKLNNSNLTFGAVETYDRELQPGYLFNDGVNTLYLQEMDLEGNWSPTVSHSITVAVELPKSPAVYVGGTSVTDGNTYEVSDNEVLISWIPSSSGVDIYRYRISFDAGTNFTEVSEQFISAPMLADGDYNIVIQVQDIFYRNGVATTFILRVNTL